MKRLFPLIALAVTALLLVGCALPTPSSPSISAPPSAPPPAFVTPISVSTPATSPAVVSTPTPETAPVAAPVTPAATSKADPLQILAGAFQNFTNNLSQALPQAQGTQQSQQAIIDSAVKTGVQTAVQASQSTPVGALVVGGVSLAALIVSKLLDNKSHKNTTQALTTAITALGTSSPTPAAK